MCVCLKLHTKVDVPYKSTTHVPVAYCLCACDEFGFAKKKLTIDTPNGFMQSQYES